MKIIIKIMIFSIVVCSDALSMTDDLYREYMRNDSFNKIDKLMATNWKKCKREASNYIFNFLLDNQREWVQSGRDEDANFINSRYPQYDKMTCYIISTLSRAIWLDLAYKCMLNNGDNNSKTCMQSINNKGIVINISENLSSYNKTQPKSVYNAYNKIPNSSGTGFYITNDGHIVTNYHVVKNGYGFMTINTHNNKEYYAKIVAIDKYNDLAILKSSESAIPFPILPSSYLKQGEEVMTLGYPQITKQGISQKATFGRINSLSGMLDDECTMQIDLPLQPGNSGGPLIDKKGNVCGIIKGGLKGENQNVNYAIKSELLYNLIGNYPEIKSKLISPEFKEKKIF